MVGGGERWTTTQLNYPTPLYKKCTLQSKISIHVVFVTTWCPFLLPTRLGGLYDRLSMFLYLVVLEMVCSIKDYYELQ